MFFQLSSWALALIIFALLLGATGVGLAVGHRMRAHAKHLSEPFSVLQGALLGLMGLVLAFGLSLAVGRYENRRATVVSEANAIGVSFLRAQLLRRARADRLRSPACSATSTRASASPPRCRTATRHGERLRTASASSASCGASPDVR